MVAVPVRLGEGRRDGPLPSEGTHVSVHCRVGPFQPQQGSPLLLAVADTNAPGIALGLGTRRESLVLAGGSKISGLKLLAAGRSCRLHWGWLGARSRAAGAGRYRGLVGWVGRWDVSLGEPVTRPCLLRVLPGTVSWCRCLPSP